MSASKTMRATPHMARSPDFCSASAYRLAAPSSVLSRYSCAQDILADVEINLEVRTEKRMRIAYCKNIWRIVRVGQTFKRWNQCQEPFFISTGVINYPSNYSILNCLCVFSSTCFQADLAGMDLSCLTCSELNKKIQALEGNASETQRELTAAKQSMEVVCAQLERI